MGDAQFQKKCLGKMEDVGKEGRTVLFVSHNIAAINRLCSKCVYLEHGVVANIGTTSVVVESYLSAGFSTQSGEVIIEGGEDEIIRMISARTVGAEGTPQSVFRSDEDIRVILTYQVTRQVEGLSVYVEILTGAQEGLWQLCDWEEYPELLENREAGIWVAEWTFPANILKPARYFLGCGVHNEQRIFHKSELFQIEITPEGTSRLVYKVWGVSGGPLSYKVAVSRPVKQG